MSDITSEPTLSQEVVVVLQAVKSLDEWDEDRYDRVQENSKKPEVPPPPPNFDPTQFDIFTDARGWSHNINNPYVAAKLAAEHRLRLESEEEIEPDGEIHYQSKTDEMEKPIQHLADLESGLEEEFEFKEGPQL